MTHKEDLKSTVERICCLGDGGIRGSSQVQDGDHMLGGSERAIKKHSGGSYNITFMLCIYKSD